MIYVDPITGALEDISGEVKMAITPEELERLKKHYGAIWDSTSTTMRKLCGLDKVTREGYIRKNLREKHGVGFELEEIRLLV